MSVTHHATPYPLHGSSSDNSKHIIMKNIYIHTYEKVYISKQLLVYTNYKLKSIVQPHLLY